jgi:hypothetical protein
MARIAMIWSGILDFTVTPEQVCLCMAGLKLARQAKRHKRDNLVDAAGYLALVERLAEPDAAAGLDPAHLPDWLK